MADDISRRIDDLLSGAIDEQVREQRALSDTMIGVRDGVSRLVGDVAALSARVTESRETSQGLREELPFLVQREVSSAVNSMSVRVDVLETAIGELVASLAGLEDRVGPDVIIGGVADRLQSMRATDEEQAGAATAQAAESAVREATESLSAAFEDASAAMTEMVDKHHTQIARRLADVKKWADDVESRMKSLEKTLESNVKMPGEVRKQLNELTGATQDMTDSVLEEIRINAESAAARISASVEGLDREAIEMNRRFGEMNDAMRGFQEQMLAYLQVRDVALEERRDQIVTELLAEFFNELPERDRERTVGRLRTVFARRRDRRDADRYRAGGKPTPLPDVPPEAVARAQADIAREQRRSERPWSEPAVEPVRGPDRHLEPPRRRPSTAASQDDFDADFDADLDSGGDFGDEPGDRTSPPAKRAAAKKKATTKKTPAKTAPKTPAKKPAKKPAAKKTTAKKTPTPDETPDETPGAPEAAGIDEPDVTPDEIAAEVGFEIAAEIVAPDAAEIDVVEMQVFADVDAEEAAAAKPAAKKKAAAKKKPAAKKKAEPVQAGAEAGPEAGAEAGAGEEPPAVSVAPESEDTLQQALARVQALVDQHRKTPGGGRKR